MCNNEIFPSVCSRICIIYCNLHIWFINFLKCSKYVSSFLNLCLAALSETTQRAELKKPLCSVSFRNNNNGIKRVLHRILHSFFQQGQKKLETLQRCPQQRKKGMLTDFHLMVLTESTRADLATGFTL